MLRVARWLVGDWEGWVIGVGSGRVWPGLVWSLVFCCSMYVAVGMYIYICMLDG